MKTHLSIVAVAAVIVVMAAPARAGPYSFEDLIDGWSYNFAASQWYANPAADGFTSAQINEDKSLSYTHDLTDDVDFAAGDKVTQAWLELDFTNDLTDGKKLTGIVKWDFREFVRVAYDGSGWVEVGEVDSGQHPITLNIDWLNDNGRLDVTLDVSNDLHMATTWLDHSRVYGTATAPVPGAVLLGGLGLGTAGMRLRRRRS